MKHVIIIVPDGQSKLSTVACIVGASEIFEEANAYCKKTGTSTYYKVETAGVSKKVDYHNGVVSVQPQTNISSVTRTNLIIIPSSDIRTYESATKGNRLLIDWIAQQYKNGAEVASICSGAYMLASSGVLDGHSCSIHWAHTDSFRNLFPNVDLKIEKLITDEHGIYTNGGGYSFLNFMLYLIEKFYNRQAAIHCSKIFQIDIDRQSQSAFAIFSTQKNHDDDVVKKAQAYIEKNLHEKISVENLSTKFAVGRRNFDRRFIKATGNTPVEYAQRVRIESAKKAFETTRKNVNEVMYEVGYSDVKAFRDIFRRITGLTPLDYRSKYNRNLVN